MYFVIIALAMGLLMPLQTAANSRLRGVVGPAYVSTLVSFSVSTLALLLVSLLAGIPILPTHEMLAEAPCWSWFVGIVAVVTITIAIHLFKEIGQLQALIIPMFSQLIFSLLIDHFGSRLAFWQLMAVVSGILSASITGAYAQLSAIVGNPIQATTVAFFVATMALLLFCTCMGKTQLVARAFSRDYPWWMWIGGLCGAVIVLGNAWLVGELGVGVFTMSLLVGQLALSMLMEHLGWLGAPRKAIAWPQIVGILLMLGGVALIRL